MKLFFRYLRDRYAALLVVALCLGICAVVFALLRLPVSAVGYAALLCGAVAAVWLTVGFLRYLARHRQLVKLQCEIALTLEHLPEPGTLTDADYQALLRTLDGERRALEEEQQARYRDMMEYYTTWAHQIKTPIAAMRLILQDEDSDQSRLLGRNCSGWSSTRIWCWAICAWTATAMTLCSAGAGWMPSCAPPCAAMRASSSAGS